MLLVVNQLVLIDICFVEY